MKQISLFPLFIIESHSKLPERASRKIQFNENIIKQPLAIINLCISTKKHFRFSTIIVEKIFDQHEPSLFI